MQELTQGPRETGDGTEKWIHGVSEGDRPADAAVHALRARLGAVLHSLPPAAEGADEGAEAVHRLRVSARRAAAALRLYKELLPRRRYRWMKRQLRRVRRAAGEVRDCDVLLQRLAGGQRGHAAEHWLAEVREERAEARGAVAAVRDRLTRGRRFERRLAKLLRRVRVGGDDGPRLGEWARQNLRAAAGRFFGTAPTRKAGRKGLHQFRVRAKELRYTMELLGGAFPESFRSNLYPAVEAIQDRLGQINDLATAVARLRRRVRAARGPAAADRQRLLAEERAQFDQARQAFVAWCSPERLRELRDAFEDLLSVSPQAGPGLDGSSPIPRLAPVTDLHQ